MKTDGSDTIGSVEAINVDTGNITAQEGHLTGAIFYKAGALPGSMLGDPHHTEERMKEFDEAAEAASAAQSKMFFSIFIAGQMTSIVLETAMRFRSGMPKDQAIREALPSLAKLKEMYPDHSSKIDPVVEVYEKFLAATKPSQDEPKACD